MRAHFRLLAVLSACAVGLAACAHAEQQTRSVPARTAAPASPASAAPAATRAAAAVPAERSPRPAAEPTPSVPRVPAAAAPRPTQPAQNAPPDAGAPQILSIGLSPLVVRAGTTVHADVRTTAGVIAVEARLPVAAIPVPRTGEGHFSGSATIPPLPPFVHGSYAVTFVARDARGRTTQSAVSVTVP